MNETKFISPKQYADLMGFHVSYIHRMLQKEKLGAFPGVISVQQYSRFYLIEVLKNISAKEISEAMLESGFVESGKCPTKFFKTHRLLQEIKPTIYNSK